MVKKNIKVFVSATMAIVTVLGTTGAMIKLNKESEYEGKNIIFGDYTTSYTEESGDLETTLSKTDIFLEENTYLETESQNLTTGNYSELKEQLNLTLSKKYTSKEINGYINEILDDLNDNYDSSYKVYRHLGMIDKETYLQSFVDIIKSNVNDIIIVDEDSELGKQKNLKNVKGLFMPEQKIILINSNYISEIKEILLHEILHSSQCEKIINQKSNLDYGMFKILTEGESATSSMLLSSNIEFNNGLYVQDKNKECFMYAPDSTENISYSRYYNMLCVLAGFDTMEEFKRNGYDETILIDEISSKYNIDVYSFLQNIKEVASMVEHNPSIVLDKILEVEKSYIQCLRQDVINANSPEEIKQILNVYRDYKIQYSSRIYESSVDITNNILGINELEEMLRLKVIDINLFVEGKNEMVFDVIMLNASQSVKTGQERSIEDILYFELEDDVVFINKHTNEAKIYNINDLTLNSYKCEQHILDSAISIINSDSEKIL